MRHSLPALLTAGLLTIPPALAGEAEPALRPLAQASTKTALSGTKLPDEILSAVHADSEEFARSWGTHVLKDGSAAFGDDLRAAVDAGLRDKLQARGIALSEQEAIIDAMRLRAEATLQDFRRMTEAQANVKLALQASGTEEPALSAVLEEIKTFAATAHEWVAVPGTGGGEREPAAGYVEREIGPLLDENEFPDKHRAATLAALTQWLEARASIAGDAGK
jgi:hypothetical protein